MKALICILLAAIGTVRAETTYVQHWHRHYRQPPVIVYPPPIVIRSWRTHDRFGNPQICERYRDYRGRQWVSCYFI